MVTAIAKKSASWPVDGQSPAWPWIYELLKAAQYEQAAKFLGEAQLESERTGETILSSTIAATHQICLALAASQAEVEWHQQAFSAARERNQILKEQLHSILSSVSKKGPVTLGKKVTTLVTGSAANPELPRHESASSAVRQAHSQRLHRLLPFTAGLGIGPPQPSDPTGKTCLLVIYCLGPFRVYQNEQLVEKWNGLKGKSIFKYLVVNRERPIHREVLMDLFWPEAEPEAARKNLYQAIFSLRQTLQASCPDFAHILLEDSCYTINPELEVCLDSEVFTRHYQAGQRLEREGYLPEAVKEYELADSLYEGEFLPEDLYEDWTAAHRENLKYAHLNVLDRLSQYYFDQAQFAQCITFCHKLLAEDSCREDVHRRLMQCYFRQGQRHLALRQYHLCVEALERELDVPPMPATVELYQQLQANRG